MTSIEMVTIGDATLYYGDNLEVMATLKGVNSVITDPPYIIKTSGGGKFRKSRTYLDDIQATNLADGFNIEVFKQAERLGIQALVTFYSPLQEDIIYNHFKGMYFDNSCPMFWHKTNPIPFANKSMQSDIEHIRFGWRAPFYPQGEFGDKSHMFSSVFSSSRGVKTYGHPTEKPVALMQKLVINASKLGDVVLDPFMGSGTTGEACLREGRAFIGIEHNREYFNMAVKRLNAVYLELKQPVAVGGFIKGCGRGAEMANMLDPFGICRDIPTPTKAQLRSKPKVTGADYAAGEPVTTISIQMPIGKPILAKFEHGAGI